MMTRFLATLFLAGAFLSAGPASAARNGLSNAPFVWGSYGGALSFSRVYVSSLVNPDGSAQGTVQTVTAPIWAPAGGPHDGDLTSMCTGSVRCEQIGTMQFQFELWKGSQQSYAINRLGAAVMGGFSLTDPTDTNSAFSFLQIYTDGSNPAGVVDGGGYAGKANGQIPRWSANPNANVAGWNYGAAYQYQFFDVPYDIVHVSPLELVSFETALATYDPASNAVTVLADFLWSFDTLTGSLTGGQIAFQAAPSAKLLSAYGRDFPSASYRNGMIAYTGPIPEPESWALLLMGFGLTGGAVRLRRRFQQPRDAVSAKAG